MNTNPDPDQSDPKTSWDEQAFDDPALNFEE